MLTMDNLRLILIAMLMFIGLLLWQEWQADYGKTPAPAPVAGSTAELPDDTPQVTDFSSAGSPAPPTSAAAVADAAAEAGRLVTIETDLFRIRVDTVGGTLRDVALLAYPVDVDTPDQPYRLVADDSDLNFLVQGGLLSNGAAPGHRATYTAEADSYRMADGVDELAVPLRWRDASGISVTKTLRFKRDSYVIDVAYDVENGGGEEWAGRSYQQLQRGEIGRAGFIYTFSGVALSSDEDRYQKFDYGDLEDADIDVDIKNGWIAFLQHYFVVALLPPPEETRHYYSKVLDGETYLVGDYGDGLRLAPGESGALHAGVYIGPKEQDRLEGVAPGLVLTVDYGVLWFIAKPLFIALQAIHSVTNNWGWAIIVLTIAIKLFFYPLSAAGYRSMANMRRVQPRMAAIKERYGNDKQRMNQAMMELYKTEKINPLGGCLPILVQIPVFIALYWVLLESVEMRHAPFVLWLDDLSSRDPFFVLPLIMGISMFIQQKLNPAAMDPMQEKVMQILPIVFTVFFAFFPSGLVLYWVVNNILSIAQQWVITRRIEAAAPARA